MAVPLIKIVEKDDETNGETNEEEHISVHKWISLTELRMKVLENVIREQGAVFLYKVQGGFTK
jgi:hypothetical protein